jgi:hypothetical protein
LSRFSSSAAISRRWDRENLPIDVPDLMPKRGDDQMFDVWRRNAGDAAGFGLPN